MQSIYEEDLLLTIGKCRVQYIPTVSFYATVDMPEEIGFKYAITHLWSQKQIKYKTLSEYDKDIIDENEPEYND